MLKRVELEIPDNVVISCPEVDFKLRVALDACTHCKYYDGLGVITIDMSLPWYKRYAIRCNHPIERRTQPAILREGTG